MGIFLIYIPDRVPRGWHVRVAARRPGGLQQAEVVSGRHRHHDLVPVVLYDHGISSSDGHASRTRPLAHEAALACHRCCIHGYLGHDCAPSVAVTSAVHRAQLRRRRDHTDLCDRRSRLDSGRLETRAVHHRSYRYLERHILRLRDRRTDRRSQVDCESKGNVQAMRILASRSRTRRPLPRMRPPSSATDHQPVTPPLIQMQPPI